MTRERLEQLAASEDWRDRQDAAMDPECPQETLKVLSGDEDWGVRSEVAQHPACPQETLKVLAGDAYCVRQNYWTDWPRMRMSFFVPQWPNTPAPCRKP